MKEEKFISECKTVLKFIQLYCDDKHKIVNKKEGKINLIYKNKNLDISLKYNLCEDCASTFKYSYERLQNCPYEDKPRCRRCPKPCYERNEWKILAKIMKYSGMKLGLTKIKKLFRIKK